MCLVERAFSVLKILLQTLDHEDLLIGARFQSVNVSTLTQSIYQSISCLVLFESLMSTVSTKEEDNGAKNLRNLIKMKTRSS